MSNSVKVGTAYNPVGNNTKNKEDEIKIASVEPGATGASVNPASVTSQIKTVPGTGGGAAVTKPTAAVAAPQAAAGANTPAATNPAIAPPKTGAAGVTVGGMATPVNTVVGTASAQGESKPGYYGVPKSTADPFVATGNGTAEVDAAARLFERQKVYLAQSQKASGRYGLGIAQGDLVSLWNEYQRTKAAGEKAKTASGGAVTGAQSSQKMTGDQMVNLLKQGYYKTQEEWDATVAAAGFEEGSYDAMRVSGAWNTYSSGLAETKNAKISDFYARLGSENGYVSPTAAIHDMNSIEGLTEEEKTTLLTEIEKAFADKLTGQAADWFDMLKSDQSMDLDAALKNLAMIYPDKTSEGYLENEKMARELFYGRFTTQRNAHAWTDPAEADEQLKKIFPEGSEEYATAKAELDQFYAHWDATTVMNYWNTDAAYIDQATGVPIEIDIDAVKSMLNALETYEESGALSAKEVANYRNTIDYYIGVYYAAQYDQLEATAAPDADFDALIDDVEAISPGVSERLQVKYAEWQKSGDNRLAQNENKTKYAETQAETQAENSIGLQAADKGYEGQEGKAKFVQDVLDGKTTIRGTDGVLYNVLPDFSGKSITYSENARQKLDDLAKEKGIQPVEGAVLTEGLLQPVMYLNGRWRTVEQVPEPLGVNRSGTALDAVQRKYRAKGAPGSGN